MPRDMQQWRKGHPLPPPPHPSSIHTLSNHLPFPSVGNLSALQSVERQVSLFLSALSDGQVALWFHFGLLGQKAHCHLPQ